MIRHSILHETAILAPAPILSAIVGPAKPSGAFARVLAGTTSGQTTATAAMGLSRRSSHATGPIVTSASLMPRPNAPEAARKLPEETSATESPQTIEACPDLLQIAPLEVRLPLPAPLTVADNAPSPTPSMAAAPLSQADQKHCAAAFDTAQSDGAAPVRQEPAVEPGSLQTQAAVATTGAPCLAPPTGDEPALPSAVTPHPQASPSPAPPVVPSQAKSPSKDHGATRPETNGQSGTISCSLEFQGAATSDPVQHPPSATVPRDQQGNPPLQQPSAPVARPTEAAATAQAQGAGADSFSGTRERQDQDALPDSPGAAVILLAEASGSEAYLAVVQPQREHASPLFQNLAAITGLSAEVPPPAESTTSNIPGTGMRALPVATSVPALISLSAVDPSAPVEVMLAPEELGRLSMTMVVEGERMHVTLSCERPETADLMRRHADQLVQEFREAGYSGATLSFGRWGGGGAASQGFAGWSTANDSDGPIPESQPQPLHRPMPIGDNGLDIRL